MAQLSEDWKYGDPCQCGCGGQPKGKRSRFLPGHDARMHRAPFRALGPADRKMAETRRVIATKRRPTRPAVAPLTELTTKWQHRVPQENVNHGVAPKLTNARVCGGCGKPIKRVDANAGPESLMAMFRL